MYSPRTHHSPVAQCMAGDGMAASSYSSQLVVQIVVQGEEGWGGEEEYKLPLLIQFKI